MNLDSVTPMLLPHLASILQFPHDVPQRSGWLYTWQSSQVLWQFLLFKDHNGSGVSAKTEPPAIGILHDFISFLSFLIFVVCRNWFWYGFVINKAVQLQTYSTNFKVGSKVPVQHANPLIQMKTSDQGYKQFVG